MFENLSSNGKLLRILSALCRQQGGEIRVACEMVDTPGESTQVDFFRDRHSQELVIRSTKVNEVLLESMRLTPEAIKPPATAVETPKPIAVQAVPEGGFTASSPGLSEEQLSKIEKSLQKRRIAAALREEMRTRNTST